MFNKKIKTIIYVEGMSCKHCTSKVKNTLESLDNIEKVKVNLNKKEVTIFSKNEIDSKKINNTITNLGYEVRE